MSRPPPIRRIVGPFTGSDPGWVPDSPGGTDKYLRADGTWVIPPGGGGGGSPGAAGAQGIPGNDGYNGEDGARGPAGPQGATGATGATGAAGARGIPGNDGLDGEDGRPGAAGPAGAQGVAGAAGAAGDRGLPGEDGVDGEDGLRGATGPQGPAGAPGVTTTVTVFIPIEPDSPEDPLIIPGPAGPQGPAGSGGGGGGTATTIEVALGALATRGKFTITDGTITATSKVLVWQAPGPYTGKGTSADEAEMAPVQILATEPATGSAIVKWRALGHVAIRPQSHDRSHGGRAQIVGAVVTQNAAINDNINSRLEAVAIGKVGGNVKFSYMVL